MAQGWVRNWRQIEDWEWYKTPNMAHLFQHLVRRANHRSKRWQGIVVEKGQLITSVASLKAQTGVSARSIRTCLEHLKATNEITIKTTNRYTMISVCNYETYQSTSPPPDKPDDKPVDKQATSGRQTSDKQTTTNKNVEKDKNENTDKKRRGFTPPLAWDVEVYGKSIDYNIDGQQFVDFYVSKGWMIGKNKMKDWKAAVRTWKKRQQNGRTKEHRRDFEGQRSEVGTQIQV